MIGKPVGIEQEDIIIWILPSSSIFIRSSSSKVYFPDSKVNFAYFYNE